MTKLDAMETACRIAQSVAMSDPDWMRAYCAVCDPQSVLQLVAREKGRMKSDQFSGTDTDVLCRIITGLTDYIKSHTDYSNDPARDYLLLQARQALSRAGS